MPRRKKGEQDILQNIESLLSDMGSDMNVGSDSKPNQSIVPMYSYRTKDKVSMTLVDKNIVNKGEQLLQMEKTGNTPVTTKLSVSLDLTNMRDLKKVSITSLEDFNYFDKSVFDAIVSLMNAGNRLMSLRMIFRTMVGKSSDYHPSPNQLDAVRVSIEKMRNMDVFIDRTEEAQNFSLKKNDAGNVGQFILNEKFLSVRYIRANINGSQTDAIEPISTPILLNYASSRQQIASVEMTVLSTPISKSPEVIAYQEYILYRIEAMKSSTKLSHMILFETILTSLSMKQRENIYSQRSFLRSFRENILKMLEYWKGIQYIKDYVIHGSGKKNKYYKIEIIL